MNKIRNLSLVAAALAIGWLVVGQAELFAAQKKETPAMAAAPLAMGTLVIKRAPNLGPTVVGLKIDGQDVAKIGYNRSYNAPISAGSHVLTTWPVVSLDGARPVELRVNVEPGKTYTFTAGRQDIQIVLR
jgi:hypothetical protein